MRRNILVALSAAIALLALPSLASAHASSSDDSTISSSSSLLKRHDNGNQYCTSNTYSLCAHNTQDRCACKPTCGGQETECPKPKHAERGQAIYYGRRCSIECNSGMELNKDKDDCKCKPNWVNKGTYCEPPTCPENEVFDHKSNTCICIPGCDRNGNNNRCKPNCGNNQEWKNGECRCIPGYEFNENGKCKVKCDASEHLERKNGVCQCMPGYVFNNKGKCKPKCDANEHLEFKNGNCQCIAGYKFNNKGKCKPQCDANDHLEFKNGGCQCMDGFKWKNNQCVPSYEGKNMEWNGKECVCMPGCRRHPNKNWCEPPQCRDNEVYNSQVKQCVCKPGYKRTLWGFCVPEHPQCGPWSYWNGHECVCKPGCKKNGNDHCTPGPSQIPHPNPPQPGGDYPTWPFPGIPGGNYPHHHHHQGGPFEQGGGPAKEVKKEIEQQPKHKRSAHGVPVWSSKLHTRDQDALFCPDGLSACPISASLGGYECVDTAQELENCGGCAVEGNGTDCTAIPGAEGVGCNKGQCVVFSCSNGFRLSSSGTCVHSLTSQ